MVVLQGCQHCVLKKSERVTAGHGPAQAQEEPAGWRRFPVFV